MPNAGPGAGPDPYGGLDMAASLSPRHLGRYRDVARLLLKHRHADLLELSGPGDPEGASAADAEALVSELERMGPTFVKLGQLLSTRADLLPPVYLEALSRLQDDVEPFGFAEVERIVSAELGARMSRAFTSFQAEPMASASLGQVHEAVLRDGRPVAVKVQRPGIRARVVEDMEVVEELAGFLDEHTRAGRRFGFSGMVEQFRRSIIAELDYRQEAANLRLLGQHLARYDLITVPQPIDDYTTSAVLTMELVRGRNISSLGPLGRLELDGAPLADQLFRAYLDQILVDGFIHADPHPGNVLVTEDGRLALIDLGMVARLTSGLQESLLRLLLAVSDGRAEEVAAVLAGLGEELEDYDADRFRRQVVTLVTDNQARSMAELQTGRMVAELANLAAGCSLRLPVELTLLAKALLNLDEVARLLDPQFRPNAAIQAHVGQILHRRMLHSASPGRLLTAALDAKEFAEKLPGRVNQVMDALAEGKLTLNVQGIDESELMRGIQKLANRVTTGVVVAALVLAAALVAGTGGAPRLWGYSILSVVLFAIAALAGLWLLSGTLRHDLPQHRRRRR